MKLLSILDTLFFVHLFFILLAIVFLVVYYKTKDKVYLWVSLVIGLLYLAAHFFVIAPDK